MTILITINYPEIPADIGEKLKGQLQERDILADFGPGQSLWQHFFSRKRPNMQWCTIIEPDWFENYNQTEGPMQLTETGGSNLILTARTILEGAGSPITILCHQPGEKAGDKRQLSLTQLEDLLNGEGLPRATSLLIT